MGINSIFGNRRRALQYYNTITDTVPGQGTVEFQSERRCPVKSAVFYGDCIQADTPSPESPQPILSNNSAWAVNGNDLWDKTKVDRVTANNILPGYTSTTEYFEGQGNEGTSSLAWSSGSISIFKSDTYVIPAGSYIVSIDITLLEVGKYDDRISIFTYGADSKHTTTITTLKKGITNRVYITINTNFDMQYINMYLNNNKVRVAWDTLRIYAVNTQRIDLSGIKLYGIDDVRDEFDSATGKLTRRIGVTTYRGSASENWGMEVLSGKNNFYIEEPLATGKTSDKILCSHGRWVTSSLRLTAN